MSERDLSVVVFGASGITGRGVAAYLSGRADDGDFRWAVAGRDLGKLERVLGEVGCTPPESIVADVGDPASLAAMAARTRVVLDLVGPYTLHGTPVIEACVENGAHYVDLTGEIPFVRRTIDAFHERAAEAGVKVVQVSGFEALPPTSASCSPPRPPASAGARSWPKPTPSSAPSSRPAGSAPATSSPAAPCRAWPRRSGATAPATSPTRRP